MPGDEPVGHGLSFFRRRLPGMAVLVHHQPGVAGGRAIGPDGVYGVGVHRHQLRAALRQRLARRLHPGAGVQPRIVTDPPADRGMIAQPRRDGGLRHALILPMRAIHLLAHLQGVAAVHEDRGFLRQHHGASGRTLKARQPRQPLRIGADIFAHMLVSQRHDKAVQRHAHQLGAQRFQAIFISGHQISLGLVGPLAQGLWPPT